MAKKAGGDWVAPEDGNELIDDGSPAANLIRYKYYKKECYSLINDNSDIGTVFNFWSGHVNGVMFKKYKDLFHGKILDIGCNIGASSALAASYEDITEVVGVDIFYKAISAAVRVNAHLGYAHKTRFQVMDFADQSMSLDEVFDGAMSFHCLEHIYPEDLDTFVSNICKSVKQGAPVLISIPFDHEFGSTEHVSYFTEESLKNLFQRNGFTCFEVYRNPGQEEILTGLFTKD